MSIPKIALLTQPAEVQFSFGAFELRPDGTLLRHGVVLPLPPKELSVLRLLLANAGKVVSADKLKVCAWSDVHVSADSISRCVSSLRARLDAPGSIATIYKRGYRLEIPVTPVKQARQPDVIANSPVSPERSVPRLALLPFSVGMGVPESFGPSVTEEISVCLVQQQCRVDVLALHTVFSLVRKGYDAQHLGRVLQADLALIGSILGLPRHYRLRVEMIETLSHVQLWIEDFIVPRNRFFDMSGDMAIPICSRIADRLMTGLAVSPRLSFGPSLRPALQVQQSSRPTAASEPVLANLVSADW